MSWGAYTRLSHEGLGCLDWPGCYGSLIVSDDTAVIKKANQIYSERPLKQAKAWKEAVHCYDAGGAWAFDACYVCNCLDKSRETTPAIMGASFPYVAGNVSGFIRGVDGNIIIKAGDSNGAFIGRNDNAVVVNLATSEAHINVHGSMLKSKMYKWAIVGLAIIYMQISPGGWTGSNYAALVCPGFPVCRGSWWPSMDFSEGFTLWRELGVDYEVGVLNSEALYDHPFQP